MNRPFWSEVASRYQDNNGPDFLCIGAQKAGTTWLYEKLRTHPQVAFPGRKEVHFWDLFYDRGVDWYKQLYAQFTGKVAGDITPAYAILPRRRIQKVCEFNARIPIIFIMRNPIERAWSLALMNLRQLQKVHFEGENIHPEHLTDEFFRWQMNLKGSRARSNYYACLRNWFEFFSKEQFLLLEYETLLKDPKAVLVAVSRHIGIDPLYWENMPSESFSERIFAGEKHSVRESLRGFAVRMYREQIDKLSELLGKDYSYWYKKYLD